MTSFTSLPTQHDGAGKYRVLSSVNGPAAILLIGTAGARDLLLYEYSDSRAARYKRFYSAPPEIIYSQSGRPFIRLPREWGGAAHYVAYEFVSDGFRDRLHLWTTLGEEPSLARFVDEMERIGVRYSLSIFSDRRRPLFPGVVFETGERYYSKRHIVLGTVETLLPDYLPQDIPQAKLTVLCSQPMLPLLGFLERAVGPVATQLWEYDLPDLLADAVLRERVWEQLSNKCALINLNEVELWLLGRIYYDHNRVDFSSSDERAAWTDSIVEQLANDWSHTLILVGLGPLGALLACKTRRGLCRLALPSLNEPGAFGGAGGDTAWASALKVLARAAAGQSPSLDQLRAVYDALDQDYFAEILRAFVLGGVKATFTPDPLHPKFTASTTYKAQVDRWASAVRRLPALKSTRELWKHHRQASHTAAAEWAPHQYALTRREDDELENLIWQAYGKMLAGETLAIS